MVGDPGECDGDVRAIGSNPGNMNVATPAMGEMVSLGATDSGYIEAWLNPRNALMDDTSFVKAPDADFSPEDAQPRRHFGHGDAGLPDVRVFVELQRRGIEHVR